MSAMGPSVYAVNSPVAQPQRAMTFSISAPHVTEEELQRERDALSEKERMEIEQDVQGTSVFLETPDMTTQGLAQFQLEMSLIPDHKKEAYLEAIRRVPDIVEKETNPIKFLRSEHFDAKKAARRMVANWDMRRSAFGEKAFSPMTLKGALSEDMETMETGFIQLLRPGGEEERAIILFDRPALPHSIFNRDSAIRVMWYVCHVASENPFTQRNGAIVIFDAQKYGMEHYDRKLSRRKWKMFDECNAIQLSALHLCTAMSRTTYNLIMPAVRVFMGRRNRLRTIVHAGPAHADELVSHGLPREILPAALGGKVTMDHFRAWLEERRTIESS